MRFASYFVFSHDQLALIVDRIVSEADKDNDGCINFEEYKKAIDKLDIEEKMAFIGFKWKKTVGKDNGLFWCN